MKIRPELFNLATGFLLGTSGMITLYKGQFEVAVGWVIFGSMYLVMGSYTPSQEHSLLDNVTNQSRVIFRWVGLVGSLTLLLYYLLYA